MTEQPSFAMLVNAMRHRSVHVMVNGTPTPLPRVAPPHVLPAHVRPDGGETGTLLTIAVPNMPKVLSKHALHDEDTELTTHDCHGDQAVQAAQIYVEETAQASAVLNDLPALDGVIYLVDPEVKFQFPHRTDFAVPSTYTYIGRQFASDENEKKDRSEKNSKAGKKAKKSKSAKKKSQKRTKDSAASRRTHQQNFVLASISLAGSAVAGPDTPTVAFLDD